MSIGIGTRVYVNWEGVKGTGIVAESPFYKDGNAVIEFKDSQDVTYHGEKINLNQHRHLHDCGGVCVAGWWVPPRHLRVASSRLDHLIQTYAKKHNFKGVFDET